MVLVVNADDDGDGGAVGDEGDCHGVDGGGMMMTYCLF